MVATASEKLTEVRQYIEDLELGLTERLEALGARLEAIEKGLALLNASLGAKDGPGEAELLADEAGP